METNPDAFELINLYADKQKGARVLLAYNHPQWVVTVKGETEEKGKGASPLEAYSDLVEKLNLGAKA
jgi:hypothetical protein